MERRAARRARTHQSLASTGRSSSSSSSGSSGVPASAPRKSSCHCGVAWSASASVRSSETARGGKSASFRGTLPKLPGWSWAPVGLG
uniref:Uncharacterized protein n=1 Tax=Arundo donax TaxID=35708 RepID=A0A0A9N5G7_ARUDO